MNFLLKFSGKRFFVNKMHLIVRRFVKVAFRMQFSCENKIRSCDEPGLSLVTRLPGAGVETERETL